MKPRFALSSLFGEHLVLQRGQPIPIFGTASPGSEVFVTLQNVGRKTVAGPEGRWRVQFPAAKAGGPFSLTVTNGRQMLTRRDLFVGDVWVCSGQSNMERILANTFAWAQEIPAAKYPQIRHYRVPKKDSATPIEDPQGEWKVCNPKNAGAFTAVGYFFAREVHRETGVPIGLLNCSWGGSEIEPYVPIEVFRKGGAFHHLMERQNARPELPNHKLGSHFNGMVHALRELPIKGFVWYQGESNTRVAEEYSRLFPAMIQAWRKAWRNSELPFYFVQLPNYSPANDPAVNVGYPEMRAAQAAALRIKGTGMTVSIDVGETDDIHPFDKRELGRRIALQVLAKTYGQKKIWSGPIYHRRQICGKSIEIKFKETGRGLRVADGHVPRGFLLAGKDGNFEPAEAEIIASNKLRLTSKSMSRPRFVCYAWTGSPRCNLVNDAGLPLAPFRTDPWVWQSHGRSWPD